MRSLVVLALLLGAFVSLAMYYSFWAAFAAMHLGGMLAVAVAAFTVRVNN